MGSMLKSLYNVSQKGGIQTRKGLSVQSTSLDIGLHCIFKVSGQVSPKQDTRTTPSGGK